jgi:acyl-coenzyme A synthetase/AMP-(fatty) acid ligase
MSTVFEPRGAWAPQRTLPLLHADDGARAVAWRNGSPVCVEAFLGHVRQVAQVLPAGQHIVNLCDDRYAFLVTFCAVLASGATNVLPSSRAPQAVAEAMDAHPGCHAIGELSQATPPRYVRLPPLTGTQAVAVDDMPMIPAGQCAAINYTSGSTGRPRPHAKCWADFHASVAGTRELFAAHDLPSCRYVVATVAPQHMYGLEQSVLQPLLGGACVHVERPFFPADIAWTLAEVPAPRVLVTTPVHLRALLAEGSGLPPLAAMVSATAPMPVELAEAAERRFGAPLLEVFGSTETCGIAGRRPVQGDVWSTYPGVRLHPQPDGTLVEAPQLAQPVALADLVEMQDATHFCLRGRNTDLLEIAGKRASLADLNRRLLGIPGVLDGVIFQLEQTDAMGVRRIAALVVAPTLDEAQILQALRACIDPVFLPRPLRRVSVLPRNETGKLPRSALRALLHGTD